MISTYIFDLDDTLINTKIYAEIYPEILTLIKQRLRLSDFELEQHAKLKGVPIEPHGRYDSGDLCRELGLLDEYYEILEKHIEVVDVLHGKVFDVLQMLQEKKIGIASNSMQRTIKLYLKKYGINVDFVFSQDDAGCKKDQTTYWKKLIDKEKLNPYDCVVIGDNPIDDSVIPAKVGFKTFIIKDFSEVQDLINK
jgi:HAD superfamily hydrolase (TIGR01549 family)